MQFLFMHMYSLVENGFQLYYNKAALCIMCNVNQYQYIIIYTLITMGFGQSGPCIHYSQILEHGTNLFFLCTPMYTLW